jgi:hypothetical protein
MVHGGADRRTDRETARATRQVKASAADGPDESSSQLGFQESLVPHEQVPLSILIWGKPMHLDPKWEELFAARQRGAR